MNSSVAVAAAHVLVTVSARRSPVFRDFFYLVTFQFWRRPNALGRLINRTHNTDPQYSIYKLTRSLLTWMCLDNVNLELQMVADGGGMCLPIPG